jgi:hypothetical protein
VSEPVLLKVKKETKAVAVKKLSLSWPVSYKLKSIVENI